MTGEVAGPERMLVAEVPDWPVVAAKVAGDSAGGLQLAVAVVAANQVVAASEAARVEGVREGLRRREAQRRCPGLLVVPADPGRDARLWEVGVAALRAVAPGVEVLGPGRVALATRGPSRYFGGDVALGKRVADALDGAVGGAAKGGPGCRVGIADGYFAASLAARAGTGMRWAPRSDASGRPDRAARITVVDPGGSREFLAPLPVEALERPELADVLVRLGISTLGKLAALPLPSMLARFGPEGAAALRLAQGLDPRGVAAGAPPPDLTVAMQLDPPAERVDAVAFAGKALADQLQAVLAERGLACTRVVIGAETAHGEAIERCWRHEGVLDAPAVAERVRWQFEGWLASGQLSAGVTLLRLAPEEVHPSFGRQLGLWGGSAGADARAARSLARIQGILGPQAVATAVRGGGRDPAAQVRLVPWGDPRSASGGGMPAPWPGQVPGVAPALVYPVPLSAEVRDLQGAPVAVTGRGVPSGTPAGLSVAGRGWAEIEAWAGPWPMEERWWEEGGRRLARLQVRLVGGEAHLLVREGGGWWLEATYD